MVGGVRKRRLRAGVLVVLVAALAVAAALAGWWLVDRDQIRKQLEAKLTETLGLEVDIGRPLLLSIPDAENKGRMRYRMSY